MSEEQVLHALNALYSSKDKSQKEKANEFLEQFQKTVSKYAELAVSRNLY